jgi:hypothetical protein
MLMGSPLHNGRVSGRALGRVGTSLGAVLLAGGLLAGCSGDGDQDSDGGDATAASATQTSPDSESATPSLPVPAGVELTPEGSQLQVGDTATVAYEVKQGEVGVLDIKVTRLEKTSFGKSFVGWDLDSGQQKANPYFVRATVTNRGETNLTGRQVPLYVVDGENTLVEATSFASSFKPCEPGTFPERFRPGKKAKVCLVYLSPRNGELVAVSFRPTQESDPITWTGELEKPKPPKPPKKNQDKGDQGTSGAED